MLVHVEPIKIVVRNRVMSFRSIVNGESGPSWSEISRTFQGQSVVMAVSEMQKKAYTMRRATVPTTAPVLSPAAAATTGEAISGDADLANAGRVETKNNAASNAPTARATVPRVPVHRGGVGGYAWSSSARSFARAVWA